MAKYSKKVMGKEVGDAAVYAEPHTMAGKKTDVVADSKREPGAEYVNKMNISVGGISKGNYSEVDKTGKIMMRGYGAATKGRMTSGKMG